MQHFNTIIIGSGPSGLMCAAQLNTSSVLLLEKNKQVGGKIKVSGGGRCNVTNNKPLDKLMDNIVHNSKFLFSSLNYFGPDDIINFFNSNKCKLKEEDHNRMFPVSNSSLDVIKTLKTKVLDTGKTIKNNYEVTNVKKNNDFFNIDDKFTSENLIIATGGKTYHHLGTTGDGYKFAKYFSHSVKTPQPCETPLVSHDIKIQNKEFQGISFKDIKATLFVGKKKIKLQHDLLITHFGFSGPLALHFSYYVLQGLKKNKDIRLRLHLNDIDVPKKISNFTSENFLDFQIHGIRGWTAAFVTKGGINLKEVNPKTFESKLEKNLYFIGEVLDINAFTGGYNINSFLSTGATCANAINIK